MGSIKKLAKLVPPDRRAKMRARYRQNKQKRKRKRKRRERRPRIKQKRHGSPEGGGYTMTQEATGPSLGGGGSSSGSASLGGSVSPSGGGTGGGLTFDPHDMIKSTLRLRPLVSDVGG